METNNEIETETNTEQCNVDGNETANET